MGENMFIKSERIIITELTIDMCNDYQKNSVDDDNRRFVPDEVCETLEDAERTLKWLIESYSTSNGPFVYPIITNENINIGYVQACPLGEGFEIGYHIAQKYTGNGFATEAVKVFLPVIIEMLQIDKIYGIVLEENVASHKVLEKNGFKLIFKGIDKYQGKDRELRKYIFER
ncbi:MAG: GNAT family N-acetyltransferase [Lachnospiraceae bacterium]|nr:GNAT family N-acetyltransferase [Lachnospiraceae bacterium]